MFWKISLDLTSKTVFTTTSWSKLWFAEVSSTNCPSAREGSGTAGATKSWAVPDIKTICTDGTKWCTIEMNWNIDLYVFYISLYIKILNCFGQLDGFCFHVIFAAMKIFSLRYGPKAGLQLEGVISCDRSIWYSVISKSHHLFRFTVNNIIIWLLWLEFEPCTPFLFMSKISENIRKSNFGTSLNAKSWMFAQKKETPVLRLRNHAPICEEDRYEKRLAFVLVPFGGLGKWETYNFEIPCSRCLIKNKSWVQKTSTSD